MSDEQPYPVRKEWDAEGLWKVYSDGSRVHVAGLPAEFQAVFEAGLAEGMERAARWCDNTTFNTAAFDNPDKQIGPWMAELIRVHAPPIGDNNAESSDDRMD